MIGVFDSGFGGLTVLKKLISRLPHYDYVYLGDNARAPYGNKSQEVIFDYTKQAVDFLFRRGCRLIIIACNTASAKALRKIQQEWLPSHYPERRVLGVVIPAAEAVADELSGRRGRGKTSARLGVIGTRSTIGSGVYEMEIRKIVGQRGINIEGAAIISRPCPLLVPLVEEGWIGKPETRMIIKKYLRPLKEKMVGILILGCTHYPFLAADIGRIMGKKTKIIDTPAAVAEKTADYLKRHPEFEAEMAKNGGRLFYTTDEPDNFMLFAGKFLGIRIGSVGKINL